MTLADTARRTVRAVALTGATVALLVATCLGAGLLVQQYAGGPGGAQGAAPGPATTPTEPPEPSEPVRFPDGRPAPEQAWALSAGDRGVQVRELQHRLFQLGWLPELTTGRFDAATVEAVRGLRARHGLGRGARVDERTWRRLGALTRRPTHDQLFNVLHPGPTLFGPGGSGEEVREVQHRLVQLQWLFGDVTGSYDAATVEAVRGFQAKRGIPVTGNVDRRTLDRLVAMTREPTYDEKHNIEPAPGALDARCLTGRVLCVDKSSQTLRWVVGGDVVETFDVRFGSDELPTREGTFQVGSKSRDHVSSLYDTSMPFAMFFSGGQAVHYSPDFAANGYAGASHGCVNVRDYAGMAWLFDQVAVGDRVVVYWS